VSAEQEPRQRSAWPNALLLMFALLVLATCYLGRIEALPWQ